VPGSGGVRVAQQVCAYAAPPPQSRNCEFIFVPESFGGRRSKHRIQARGFGRPPILPPGFASGILFMSTQQWDGMYSVAHSVGPPNTRRGHLPLPPPGASTEAHRPATTLRFTARGPEVGKRPTGLLDPEDRAGRPSGRADATTVGRSLTRKRSLGCSTTVSAPALPRSETGVDSPQATHVGEYDATTAREARPTAAGNVEAWCNCGSTSRL